MLMTTLYGFQGRIGRLRYFGYSLLTSLLSGIVGMAGVFLIVSHVTIPGALVAALGGLNLLWSSLALLTKRLHDMDMSAHHLWWIYGLGFVSSFLNVSGSDLLWAAILIGVIELGIAVWLIFTRGTDGPNRFGPPVVPPRGQM